MSEEHAVPKLASLSGLWTRSLLEWADGTLDVTTRVHWLQGTDYYADLRQPTGMPSFAGIDALAKVTDEQLHWMVRQEAFAGELHFDGEHFEWQRVFDLQPRTARADRGSLHFERGVLIEHGEGGAYLEHWHRSPEHGPVSAAKLYDLAGARQAYFVRVGPLAMYARANPLQLPAHTTLSDCVRDAPTSESARRMLDCEISFCRATPEGWHIKYSTLPFRCGQLLDARATSRSALTIGDSDFHEGRRECHFRIVSLRGAAGYAEALMATH